MTAKEYLYQIRLLKTKINNRKNQLAELKEAATSLGSLDMSEDVVQTCKQGSKQEKLVTAYVDLDNRIKSDKVRLERMRNRIIERIHELDDHRYIDVLVGRYVEGLSYDNIAEDTGYDKRHVFRLHKQALRAFYSKWKSRLHLSSPF